MLNVKLFLQFDELLALEAQWQRLQRETDDDLGLFSTVAFVQSLLQTQAPSAWCVIGCYAADKTGQERLVGVVPLELVNIQADAASFRMARPLGARLAPYVEPLILRDFRLDVWKAVLHVLRRHLACSLLFLGTLHEDSRNHLCLLEHLEADQRHVLTAGNMPFIDTRTLDFESFFAGKRKATLPDARRCERRLAEHGELSFGVIRDPTLLNQYVPQICTANTDRFAGSHAYGESQEWRPVLEAFAENAQRDGTLELSGLFLDGRLLAAHLGFLYKGRRYYYMPYATGELSGLSPSKVLMSKLIEITFAEGGVFCFGIGLYRYKLDWCQAVADSKMAFVFLENGVRESLLPFLDAERIKMFYL